MWHQYDKLIICTGSYAFVPPIRNLSVELDGVFVYRTIEDLQGMIARGATCNQAGVIGAGLLGLEAAKVTV